MLKRYLIVNYAILVKAGRWNLEEVEGEGEGEGEEKPVVPEEYRIAVAEYLAGQN